jgi:dTDP-4-dehydrorhamnose 3,5-epimerase
MEIISTDFNDLYVLQFDVFTDNRGEFVKTIHKDTFIASNLNYQFQESFFSISHKNVFRGMHYQLPPNDHVKLVTVIKGRIIDVALDLRSNSPQFGRYFTIELSESNRKGLYLGSGFAHGFLSLENDTIVEYHTSTVQNKDSEAGVRWDSFGLTLSTNQPIISNRDESFLPFDSELKYF